jgi:hypothetical protein
MRLAKTLRAAIHIVACGQPTFREEEDGLLLSLPWRVCPHGLRLRGGRLCVASRQETALHLFR